jgi:hypothetical protein
MSVRTSAGSLAAHGMALRVCVAARGESAADEKPESDRT